MLDQFGWTLNSHLSGGTIVAIDVEDNTYSLNGKKVTWQDEIDEVSESLKVSNDLVDLLAKNQFKKSGESHRKEEAIKGYWVRK